jgi:hypothetical protein
MLTSDYCAALQRLARVAAAQPDPAGIDDGIEARAGACLRLNTAK